MYIDKKRTPPKKTKTLHSPEYTAPLQIPQPKPTQHVTIKTGGQNTISLEK